MATAIDDRQELLEQFQTVSPVHLHSYKNLFTAHLGDGFFSLFREPFAATSAAAARGFLIDRRFYQRGNPPSC